VRARSRRSRTRREAWRRLTELIASTKKKVWQKLKRRVWKYKKLALPEPDRRKQKKENAGEK
jgi:hypothetical protein